MPNVPSPFTDEEIELVIDALAAYTVERRQHAARIREIDGPAADAALREMMRAGVLMQRCTLEQMERSTDRLGANLEARRSEQPPTPPAFTLVEQCDGCGTLAGHPHASDCDRAPDGGVDRVFLGVTP